MDVSFLIVAVVTSLTSLLASADARSPYLDALPELEARIARLARFHRRLAIRRLAYLGNSSYCHRLATTMWSGVPVKTSFVRLIRLAAFVAPGVLASSKQAYEPGQAFRDCPNGCPEMVVVPAGTYLMGSPAADLRQALNGIEQPRHRVTIRHAFAVGRFEVTREEYAQFAQETRLHDPDGCNVHEPPNWPKKAGLSWHTTPYPQTGRDPVVCVSWDEAKAYTQWLSRKTGHSYRLLSEAEWEYVARAGTTTQAFWGDDEKRACEHGNGVDLTLVGKFPETNWEVPAPRNPNPGRVLPCHDNHVFTAPVGSYKPNAFGLYDTAGNVFEWVADCWSANYDGAPIHGSPRTDGDCTERVNRGGGWDSNPTGLRSAYRWNDPTWLHVADLGFRIAREL
jgi:sulfatase modifying factor 1